jgi:hypothetical protein
VYADGFGGHAVQHVARAESILIIDAWPKLPEAIRRAMLALAESGE